MGPTGTIRGRFQESASASATSMWSLKVAPNSEFSRSASVRRDWETRVMGTGNDIGPRSEKRRGQAGMPVPQNRDRRYHCYFAALALMPLKASVRRDL